MNFKAIFTNEMPFLIQLPDGDYEIKVEYNSTDSSGNKVRSNKMVKLNLSNNHFRAHFNPFPNSKTGSYVDGINEYLENYIVNNKITNYAFEDLKSYITFTIENEIEYTEDMYNAISIDDLKERIKTLLVQQNLGRVFEDGELDTTAEENIKRMNDEQIKPFKTDFLTNNFKSSLSNDNVYFYHQAINSFIEQYSYIRNDFFVEKLTMHTLEGTYCDYYINDVFAGKMKYAGKLPSIVGTKIWREDIEQNDLNELKNRLSNGFEIPPTKSLLSTARNLNERGEYRSAVINASAALEVAVEEKIIGKMRVNGIPDHQIVSYLETTKIDFPKRCDSQLKAQTGKSFKNDNNLLWIDIQAHRKKFRHKIAHSSLVPEEKETEKAISDFESGVNWVESL